MPIGITNTTPVNISIINDIANSTNPVEFMVKVNTILFDGYLFFGLFWVLWLILFIAAQMREKQPLVNAMYSGAIISVLAFFARLAQAQIEGNYYSILTDYQMWMFPILTIILAASVWATKER